jgi:hypothetical protein
MMILLSKFVPLFCYCLIVAVAAQNRSSYADRLADSAGGDVIRNYIEDYAAAYGAATGKPITAAVYARLRSFKIAAFYEATNELDQRITELIRADMSEQYAEAWASEKAGFILGSLPKILALQNVADDKMIQTVCETGFNVGYGVLNVLIANPRASIVSFDIFVNKYSAYAVRALHDMFPDRDITVVAGDSSVSVPNFFKKVGANTVCDMAFVDSGGPEVRHRDIVNLAPHMNFELRTRPGAVEPVTNLVLLDGRIAEDPGAAASEATEPTLLNREFSHVLIVDDLHTPELRAIFEAYILGGSIEPLHAFDVTNTPCVHREYVVGEHGDYYSFDTNWCFKNVPNYVDPKFVDSVFVKSRYVGLR